MLTNLEMANLHSILYTSFQIFHLPCATACYQVTHCPIQGPAGGATRDGAKTPFYRSKNRQIIRQKRGNYKGEKYWMEDKLLICDQIQVIREKHRNRQMMGKDETRPQRDLPPAKTHLIQGTYFSQAANKYRLNMFAWYIVKAL